MGAIFDGIILGMVLSGMIGPIFFYMINVSISGGVWKGMMVSFGAFLSDLILITLIFSFSSQFDFSSKTIYLNFVGGLVFFVVGIGGFWTKNTTKDRLNGILLIEKRGIRPFFHGILINTFNPGVIIFWIGAMSTVLAKEQENYNIVSYFLASILTILCLDFVKIIISTKALNAVNPKVFKVLNPVVSVILVVFGLNLIRKGIWP